MIIINYTKKGIAYKDCEVEDILKELIQKSSDFTINTATENMVYIGRVFVVEELIPQDNIIFRYENDYDMKCVKYGKLICEKEIPDDFGYIDKFLDRMLKL